MSKLLTTMKERLSPKWKSAASKSERAIQWLVRSWHIVAWMAGPTGVVILLISGGASWVWGKYHSNREDLTPVLTLAAGLAVAGVTLLRHFAQTDADRQRRITDGFSKAVEQLAHDKIEVRLGGIYTLERISRESADDYWTVMETLTAFVRERASWNELDTSTPRRLPTDITAVLTVIRRRPITERTREKRENWCLDLREVDLRGADLIHAHFEGALLTGAHLEGANLTNAHLEGAFLIGAHLEGACLAGAYLERGYFERAHLEGANLTGAGLKHASLSGAHLDGVNLLGARLEHADLSNAHLDGARLSGARLEHADISGAHLDGANLQEVSFDLSPLQLRVKGADISQTIGDASTRLPPNVPRPAHWPPYQEPHTQGPEA